MEGYKPEVETEKNTVFEKKLREFLIKNPLVLDVPERKETIENLQESKKKEVLGDFVIAEDFKLTDEGAGVFLAYKERTSEILAAKETIKEKIEEQKKLNHLKNLTIEEYLKEKGFNDPGILLPVNTAEKENKVYRFYELLNMDLEKYLETHNKLEIETVLSLCVRICSSVKELHKQDIIHTDLSPLNLLLKKDTIKIIDLDSSVIVDHFNGKGKKNYIGGNRFSMAPELFEDRPIFDKTVDTYAVTALLYRLLEGTWPYNIENETKNLPFEEKMKEYKKIHESGKINFVNIKSLKIKNVIEKGMKPKPEDRYQSMEELMTILMDVSNKKAQLKETKKELSHETIEKELEIFMDKFPDNIQKIDSIINLLNKTLNNDILKKMNLNITLGELEERLESCKEINDKEKFVRQVKNIFSPIGLAMDENPKESVEFQRKSFIETHTFIPLNEIFSYRIDEGDLHIHLAPSSDFNPIKKIRFIQDALKKLGEIISTNNEVKIVSATSPIVASNQELLISLGFEILGPISEKTKNVDFPMETREVSRAIISREEFLKRYFNQVR